MGEEISARLVTLRKHLSERLGERLTQKVLSERCGLTEQQVARLEHDLSGTTISLIVLLQFYSSHGYNLNWIVCADNSRTPMVIASGTELQEIGETILDINRGLEMGRARLTSQLRELGYISLSEGQTSAVESDVAEAVGLAL